MANIKLGGTTAISESSGALTIASSTLTTPTIANMANCTFPAGMVLQNKITELKDTWSWTNTTANTDGSSSTRADDSYGGILTGLTTTVTAEGADSDFLISWNLAQVSLSNQVGGYQLWFRIYSSLDTYTTPVSQGDVYSSNTRATGGGWYNFASSDYLSLSFPGLIKHTGVTLAKGSPVTYKMSFSSNYTTSGNTIYVNRVKNHTTGSHIIATVSSMSVTEIAT
jgi:hypothetical protein